MIALASPTIFYVHQLSTFATLWNALFEWITSSSLAYIYGRDESFHEEYLSVNGREYPQKLVLQDGRSSEIKETLAGCISRALPAIVTTLRLPIPILTLEQGLVQILNLSLVNHSEKIDDLNMTLRTLNCFIWKFY